MFCSKLLWSVKAQSILWSTVSALSVLLILLQHVRKSTVTTYFKFVSLSLFTPPPPFFSEFLFIAFVYHSCAHKTHSNTPIQTVKTSFKALKPLFPSQQSQLNVGCLETTQNLAPNWSARVCVCVCASCVSSSQADGNSFVQTQDNKTKWISDHIWPITGWVSSEGPFGSCVVLTDESLWNLMCADARIWWKTVCSRELWLVCVENMCLHVAAVCVCVCLSGKRNCLSGLMNSTQECRSFFFVFFFKVCASVEYKEWSV